MKIVATLCYDEYWVDTNTQINIGNTDYRYSHVSLLADLTAFVL